MGGVGLSRAGHTLNFGFRPFRDIHPGAREALELDHLSCALASRMTASLSDSPRRRYAASLFASASVSQSIALRGWTTLPGGGVALIAR